MKRKQRFAGLWYPGDRTELEKLVKVTPDLDNKDIYGVVPHAGLYYSGSLIKQFFSTLKLEVNRILLITPSHYFALPEDVLGSGNIESFECPIGDIPGFTLPVFNSGYEEVTKAEHAVEMILPFIAERKNISLCCAHINHFTDTAIAEEYACKLLSVLDDKTAVLASSDFTHYGPSFGYTPFGSVITEDTVQKVKSYDQGIAVQFAEGNGMKAYCQAVRKDKATICGIAPMLVVSEMARLGGLKGRVIGQSNSLEKSGNENNFVSYVSIAWRK